MKKWVLEGVPVVLLLLCTVQATLGGFSNFEECDICRMKQDGSRLSNLTSRLAAFNDLPEPMIRRFSKNCRYLCPEFYQISKMLEPPNEANKKFKEFWRVQHRPNLRRIDYNCISGPSKRSTYSGQRFVLKPNTTGCSPRNVEEKIEKECTLDCSRQSKILPSTFVNSCCFGDCKHLFLNLVYRNSVSLSNTTLDDWLWRAKFFEETCDVRFESDIKHVLSELQGLRSKIGGASYKSAEDQKRKTTTSLSQKNSLNSLNTSLAEKTAQNLKPNTTKVSNKNLTSSKLLVNGVTAPSIPSPAQDDPLRANKLITTDASQYSKKFVTQTTEPKVLDQASHTNKNILIGLAKKLGSQNANKDSHILSIMPTVVIGEMVPNRMRILEISRGGKANSHVELVRGDSEKQIVYLKKSKKECTKHCSKLLEKAFWFKSRSMRDCVKNCSISQLQKETTNNSNPNTGEDSDSSKVQGGSSSEGVESSMKSVSSELQVLRKMMRGALSWFGPRQFVGDRSHGVENFDNIVQIGDLFMVNEPKGEVEISNQMRVAPPRGQRVGLQLLLTSNDNREKKPRHNLESLLAKEIIEKSPQTYLGEGMYPFATEIQNGRFSEFVNGPFMIMEARHYTGLPVSEQFQRKRKNRYETEMKNHFDAINKRILKWQYSQHPRDRLTPSEAYQGQTEPELAKVHVSNPDTSVKVPHQFKKLSQAQYIDLLECISRKTGMPRWLIVSAILSSGLIVLWLCVSLSVTVEESKAVRNDEQEIVNVMADEAQDILEAPPLPKKTGEPFGDLLHVLA